MKAELLKANLSQLSFTDLNALNTLIKTHYDSLIESCNHQEDVEALEMEKDENLESLLSVISGKIQQLLN